MKLLHVSIPAKYPGDLKPLFELLELTNLKIDPGNERVQYTDPEEVVLFEICHTSGQIPSSAMTHIGIITDDSKRRKRIMDGLGQFDFRPIAKAKGDKRALLCGTVHIGRGAIGFEISTPLAHE